MDSDGAKGFFVPGYNVSGFDPDGRPWFSQRYVPCDVEGWCNATNGFDCSQVRANKCQPVVVCDGDSKETRFFVCLLSSLVT